ncbi:hypothetical protein AVEN_53546-1 [Araneus ventricosus]|uniref:BTB domain-containing protein n=1 Tax=Araneus ventricosus TaxID=182803 RepID=A0A4Y2X6V3_ARAVE|nr:hypothetical protein AVEN_53546-1 [Araneus ventricosus]
MTRETAAAVVFLVLGHIENLQWNTTAQLYNAADKYQIGELKEVCSSFLRENSTPTNAGEFVLLADTHNDSDLKVSVEDFILEYDMKVFGPNEWEMFTETNPLLAMKTMHLKYKR